jgi:hypothetical protein
VAHPNEPGEEQMSQRHDTPSERGRFGLATFIGGMTLALAIGAATGWWFGQSAAPLVTVTQTACDDEALAAAPESAPGDDLEIALGNSLISQLQLAARVDSLEDVLKEMEEQGVDPRVAAHGVIRTMSEDQISTTVASFARMDQDELDEIEDIHAFATRLSDIALDEVHPGSEDGSDVPELLFTAELDEQDPYSVAGSVFTSDADRIYAMLRMEDPGDGRLMIKWARADRPQILALRRHDLQGDRDWSSFFMFRPRGFAPGEYRVTVYTGDEAMSTLAMGTFSVIDAELR